MNIFKVLLFKLLPNTFLIFIKKLHYYFKLKKSRITDEEDLALLEKLIPKDTVVFDIGANFGLYTKFLSCFVGQKGTVYSFEPIPETYSYLTYNTRKLRFKNTFPLNMAISDMNGTAMMQIPQWHKSMPNLYEASIIENPKGDFAQFEVITITLDTFCEKYNCTPSFIKCDVEGHEWSVIKGSKKMIEKHKPLLFIEINNDLENKEFASFQLINLLQTFGYSIFINENGYLKQRTNEKKFNYYFLTDLHKEQFTTSII